jgi:adenylate cyclase
VSIARLASSIVDGIHEREVLVSNDSDESVADFATEIAEIMGGAMPVVLQYTWSKHLRMALRRRLSLAASSADTDLAVGFADLVGFTTLVQQISNDELSAMLGRFEATVLDVVVANGGRVVKHIGDEVMFAFDDPTTAVEAGLRLAEIHHFDETLPELRVGIAYGPVLSREGDLFGPMVNKASRIVPVCHPGTVLVSDDLAKAVTGTTRVALRPLRLQRHLKGIGAEVLWVARWPDGYSET